MPTTATSASLPGLTGSDTQWIVGAGAPDASPVGTLASSRMQAATYVSIVAISRLSERLMSQLRDARCACAAMPPRGPVDSETTRCRRS